jgi:hypothetical protein
VTGAKSVDPLVGVAGLVSSAARGSAPAADDLESVCALSLEEAAGPGPLVAREALRATAARMRRLHREGHDVAAAAHAVVRGCGRAFDSVGGRDRVPAEVRMLCADVADAAWQESSRPESPLAAAIEGLRAALAGDGTACPRVGPGPALAPAADGVRAGHARAALRRHPHGVPNA